MEGSNYRTGVLAGALGGVATVALCRWFSSTATGSRLFSSAAPKPAPPRDPGMGPSQPPEIEALHMQALACGEETYTDPKTGYMVFTAVAHNKRGFCCGSGCRHCPYGHTNVGKPDSVARDKQEAQQRKKDGKAPKASVYTRAGDKGTSALFSGERLGKDEHIFEVLGCVDECNSVVGVAMEYCRESGNGLEVHLQTILGRLMDVGSYVATPRATSADDRVAFTEFSYDEVTALEAVIDELNAKLPVCRAFILPTGGKAAAHLHLARCVCRRAERAMVRHFHDQPGLPPTKYMNRLSDLLFVMARFAAQHDGREDVWRPDRGLPRPQSTA
eukprot:TRINITY_DN58354_c0_g1_i1.p1 TRINITY_DN58354_c0_g1~~TRINITY_DN58354_c0_g1_i1.p1  ORF type:complete len:343 (+),score=104.57 TRINITY_DN58354_c0_g1_i1:40-1029(+)